MKIVCPFDRQIWYVHTQEQADRFQRHLQVHLPQQGDSMKAVDETPIVERYKVDWATLSEPYVRPNTLNWAIERDKNMQRFAHTLIEELSASEQRERVLREALDAPITIADLKREGIQGLCAVSAIRAVNAIMLRRAALATPAPEQPAAERIAVQQERIATLEGVLAENKRVLEIAMGTVARLSAPVSDAEINVFCWGFTEVVKARFDLIIAARTVPPAPEQNAACSCTHSRSDHVGTVAEGSNAMPCIRCSCIQYKPT